MGFELERFTDEIHGEFICPICTLVLENPMQSKCEHIFCRKCISECVERGMNCPLDQKELVHEDITPAARYFRNLLDKLMISCNYESRGCKSVVKLENLRYHVTNDCKYNPTALVVCDKGCNLTMSREGYETHNCLYHLSQALNKLNDKLHEQAKIINSLRWKVCHNVRISDSEPNILEYGGLDWTKDIGLVQCSRPLTPHNANFKIQILDGGLSNNVIIGLTGKDIQLNNQPGWYKATIGYHCDDGMLFMGNKIGERVGSLLRNGDIVECGFKYPDNFSFDKKHRTACVYFSVNGQVVVERSTVTFSEDEAYPTIAMKSEGCKVLYLDSSRTSSVNTTPKVVPQIFTERFRNRFSSVFGSKPHSP